MEDSSKDYWQDLSIDGFLSFNEFQKILENSPQIPYQSKFSFTKLIEELDSFSERFNDNT